MSMLLLALALAGATAPAKPAIAQAPPPASSAPLDPERLALAQQVVDLAFPPERRRAMASRMMDAIFAQARAAATGAAGNSRDPGMQRILDRHLTRVLADIEEVLAARSPAIYAAFARGYARMFTRDELVQIRAFVATPAGAKYMQRSAELLADPDVAAANSASMAEVAASLHPLDVEFAGELAAYLRERAAHPPSPPASSPH